MARRECRVAHLAKILMPRREARAAEMGASDRVAREPAAMSAKVMAAAAMAAKAMSAAVPMTTAVPAAMATAVTSSMAAASGDCVARQRQHEGKNRNSHHAQ
jgi:hypothetical protein